MAHFKLINQIILMKRIFCIFMIL